MPAAHAALSSSDWPRAGVAIPILYAGWFAVWHAVDWVWEGLNLPHLAVLNLASIWQAVYLLVMFSPMVRKTC